jgi:branched-chain amino acid transport system ATP-binding protein
MVDSTALDATNVGKSFAGLTALRGVTLSVGYGEVLGLLGANGAGKTTLLDIVGGEQSADVGAVRLSGEPLSGPPHVRARRGLSRTFQHPQVSAELTVAENVAVGLAGRHLTGWRGVLTVAASCARGSAPWRSAANEACRAVGLDRLERPASALSFGELRLVEVARALVQRPRVLLLDEPFPGLEDDGVGRLITAIRSVAERGCAVILVDHNINLVAGLVDRVVLLARGEVAFEGAVADCMASTVFQEEYVGGARLT